MAAAPITTLSVSTSFAGTLVASKLLQPRQQFRIGSSAQADTPFVTRSSRDFPLIESRDGHFILRFEESWQGWVWMSERLWTLPQLLATGAAKPSAELRSMEFVIPADCAIELQVGALSFDIRPSPPVHKIAPQLWNPNRAPLLHYLLLTAGILLVALAALPPPAQTAQALYDQEPISEARWVQIQPQESHDASSAALASLRPAYPTPQPRAAAPKGNPDNEKSEPPPEEIPELQEEMPVDQDRHQARQRARDYGFVALLPTFENAKFMQQAAATKFDSSRENTEHYGDLDPVDLDQKTGAWGHGIRKMGPGSGDGKDWGTVKAGDYRMAGKSIGERAAEYERKALTRPHPKTLPQLSTGPAFKIEGELKYDVIRGQLGLRQRRFEGCLDEDTSEAPSPKGILLHFLISTSGHVAHAEVGQVDNQEVRSCIEKTLLSIRFPEPADGQSIKVMDFPLRI